MHARAARGRDDDERAASRQRAFNGAGNFFADHRAHAAADEAQFQGAEVHIATRELSLDRINRVLHSERLLHRGQTLIVRLSVHEAEWIGGSDVAVVLYPVTVEQYPQAAQRV